MNRKSKFGNLTLVAVAAMLALAPVLAGAQGKIDKPPIPPVLERASFTMDDRLGQVIDIIANPRSCEAAETAILLGMEALYGGLRPLPSKDLLQETTVADNTIAANEQRLAKVLAVFDREGKCPEQQAMALDLKLFIEQVNEVAVAVGRITRQCGLEDKPAAAPCDTLIPVLEEATGQLTQPERLPRTFKPPFFVKLRSPYIPSRYTYRWDEDVLVTKPIAAGQCVVVFKETKGLMLRLRFVRLTVVRDPWATPLLARGTLVPIWILEWVPSEYVKEWNICNGGKHIEKTVTQRVVQDNPLNFFWRYYGKGLHGKGHDGKNY